MGKKKQPTYRVVAAESRRARSGAFLGHFVRSCAQGQAQRAVAVIRIEPVGGLERESGCDSGCLVAGARDLEEYLLLTLEHDLAVIHAPRGEHNAIGINQLLTSQPLIAAALFWQCCFRSAWDRLWSWPCRVVHPTGDQVPQHCKSVPGSGFSVLNPRCSVKAHLLTNRPSASRPRGIVWRLRMGRSIDSTWT